MKSCALLMILLALGLVVRDCQKRDPTHPPLTPEQATVARRAIINYLECDECEEGELEAVVKQGPAVVSSLVATLLEGPSRANLETLRRQLITNYRELKEYERTHPDSKVPGTEEQYVKTFTENYIALYRVRAATALGAIGGPEARRALEEASRKSLRTDVQAAVNASLAKIK
jgi:hypothetical protein